MYIFNFYLRITWFIKCVASAKYVGQRVVCLCICLFIVFCRYITKTENVFILYEYKIITMRGEY